MLVTNRGVDDPRVCAEAEALSRHGHDVTVLGWDRDAREDSTCKRNGIEFLQLKLRSTHGRGITQPVFLIGFFCRAWAVIRMLRPDIVHSHDLDTLPLGWWAATSLRLRLVFDAHESYPDMMVGHLPPTAVAALRALEQRLVRRSDLVITVGNRLAGHYRRMGAKKAIVVGNWKSPVEFQFSAEDIVRARRELGLDNGAIAICFVANLGRERHLESLLAAVAADQRFACVIGGDGPQTQLVQRAAGKHDNIVYLGRINPRRIPVISAACDVVYYGFDRSNPNAPWSAPNKLFEAIAAGKPVLCGDFGEIGDIVRSSRCGVIADTSTASGVSTGLEKLADRAGLAEMGRRAEALQKKFSRRAADNRLANAYQSLLSAGPTTRRAGRASCRRRPCKLASCGGAPMAHDAEDGSC